jgi:hypothetical protein
MRATLFVYGHASGHVNWGEQNFLQLPGCGDLVVVELDNGEASYSVVRHIEHVVSKSSEPTAIVITDWKSGYDFKTDLR